MNNDFYGVTCKDGICSEMLNVDLYAMCFEPVA
jgi:hypothetical protein